MEVRPFLKDFDVLWATKILDNLLEFFGRTKLVITITKRYKDHKFIHNFGCAD